MYPMRLDGSCCQRLSQVWNPICKRPAGIRQKKSRTGWDLNELGPGSAMSLPLFACRYPLSAIVGTACSCFDEDDSVYFFQER